MNNVLRMCSVQYKEYEGKNYVFVLADSCMYESATNTITNHYLIKHCAMHTVKILFRLQNIGN